MELIERCERCGAKVFLGGHGGLFTTICRACSDQAEVNRRLLQADTSSSRHLNQGIILPSQMTPEMREYNKFCLSFLVPHMVLVIGIMIYCIINDLFILHMCWPCVTLFPICIWARLTRYPD